MGDPGSQRYPKPDCTLPIPATRSARQSGRRGQGQSSPPGANGRSASSLKYSEFNFDNYQQKCSSASDSRPPVSSCTVEIGNFPLTPFHATERTSSSPEM